VRVHFPEYAKSHSGAGVIGVPGFWQELSGVVHIWKLRKYRMPLLVIPYKDANGLIQACQVRLHANDISSDEKRYCWLSSPLERHGSSSGTPIHFSFVKQKPPPGENSAYQRVDQSHAITPDKIKAAEENLGRLSSADTTPFVNRASVIENTTELLGPVPRETKRESK
jgi:hypothetical protein